MAGMEWVAIVTLLVLAEYLYFAMQAGMSRGRYEVPAPATTGNETFERVFRVQANMLEQLIAFLPSLWLFAYYVHPGVAALLGLVFLVGRFLYGRGYVESPEKRGPGFLTSFAATSILLLGGLCGAVIRAL